MSRGILKLAAVLAFFWSSLAFSFTCTTSSGTTLSYSGGSANITVPLTPTVQSGSYLIVNLANYITCKNDAGQSDWDDLITLTNGSTFNGALDDMTGTITFNGNSYPLPFTSTSSRLTLGSQDTTSVPIQLALTPVSGSEPVNGVAIKAGAQIASIVMNQKNNQDSDSANFTWNIYSENDVTIPEAACTVAQGSNVTVSLPEYPGSAEIPLTISCTSSQSLDFYISGDTESDDTTFQNTLEASGDSTAASGMGVQIMRNGSPITINQDQSIGTVDTSGTDLGLSARYNAYGTEQVKAGLVRSIIDLNFVYP